MFPRSGVNIRRLISQRKDRSYEDDEGVPPVPTTMSFENDETSQFKVALNRQLRSRSWVPSKQTKEIPKPIIIRRSEDIVRVKQGLPPLSDTPRSSESSLRSCEINEFDRTRPRPSPKLPGSMSPGKGPARSAVLCPPTPPPTKESFAPRPRSSAGIPLEHRRTRSSPRSVHHTPRAQMITPPSSAKSSLDFEHGSTSQHQPKPKDLPPTPPGSAKDTLESEGYCENLERFSRETDEAFGIESGLAAGSRVDLLPPNFPLQPVPAALAPRRSQRGNTTTLSRSGSRRGSISLTKSVSKSTNIPTRTPSRSSSISKSRRKSKKIGRRPRPILHKPSTSRWALPENARDLFTARIFHRIEADEMLPESRLEEIRGNTKSRTSLAPPKESSETMRTTETDSSCETPIEPFHLEGLPTRIGAAGVSFSVPSPIAEGPTPEPRESNTAAENGYQAKKIGQPECSEAVPAEEDASMMYQSLNFPTPPAKNPARYAHRKGIPPVGKQLPPLPTIPEVTVTSPENLVLSPTSRAVPRSNEDFIYLPSTCYTMICPTHKQGPIRLAKADLSIEALTAAIDDTLDWTAFQMAILGGAGDFFGEATDFSRPSDAELDERDDLANWFDSFGFDSPGNLIGVEEATATAAMSTPSSMPSPASTASRYSTISSHSSPRTISSGRSPPLPQHEEQAGGAIGLAICDFPIPVQHEHPSGFWNSSARDARADSFYAGQSGGIKRWGVEGHPQRPAYADKGGFLSIGAASSNGTLLSQYQGSADVRRPSSDSVQSLPQSPMMELVVSRDVEGNEYVVPMGFNLGHDLGDYLQWEHEHAFGGTYLPEN